MKNIKFENKERGTILKIVYLKDYFCNLSKQIDQDEKSDTTEKSELL